MYLATAPLLQSSFVRGRQGIDDVPVDTTPSEEEDTQEEEEDQEEEDEDPEGEEEEDASDGWQSEDDPEKLWCICRQPHNNR